MKQSKIAALLAACFVLGSGSVLLAQTSTDGKKVSPPSDTTGSGKDTGMNVPSGLSGNGPGGVGTVGAGAGTTGASPSQPSSSSKKKSGKHSKKKTTGSTSSNGSSATATQ